MHFASTLARDPGSSRPAAVEKGQDPHRVARRREPHVDRHTLSCAKDHRPTVSEPGHGPYGRLLLAEAFGETHSTCEFLPWAQGLTKFLDGTMAVTHTGGRLTVKAGPPHPIPDALTKTEPPTTAARGNEHFPGTP